MKNYIFYFLAFIISLVTMELSLRVIDFVLFKYKNKDEAMLRAYNDHYYDDNIWVEQFLKSSKNLETFFEPYTNWNYKNYKSEFLNVDSIEGRKT